MLVELMVENYAVIERLRVRFHGGFNVLSGETGSGKSIVVDALGLLFGGRAAAEMVRSGADRARISGIFEAPATEAVRARLDALGLVVEEGELLLEREILANGKSRAFAASRPVTAAVLRELAPLLGDIHGQHDQQRLFSEDEQLAILDAWGRMGPQQQGVAGLYASWKAARTALEDLNRNEQERLRMADLWSYQAKEIESIGPQAGEDESLEQERRLLQNVTRLEQFASEAYDSLYESTSSTLAQLRTAVKRIDELARIDGSTASWLEPLKTAEALIEDVALSLRDYHGRLEADPNRLEHVETRLAGLEKLKRKYGETIAEILAFQEQVKTQLETVENAEALRAQLEAAVEKAGADFRAAARKLSDARRRAAVELAKKVETELGSLAMDRTRFEVAFEEAPWSADGMDRVRFLIAPNLGEQAKPLDRIASGGELSRVALALKAVMVASETEEAARQGISRTLVFDEVDAGIGGRTAESVGRRLRRISAASQVLCVTHLAQIAGFAEHHFVVEKHEERGRTVSTIEELTGAVRTREISRMLGGQETPESLQHAEQILKLGAGR
jgi:DNA repair protein RecN (Recombination protein N)